jgi:ABC-2 type transport system ATP-binding protein
MTELAVEARGLEKTFRKGQVKALDGFDLTVNRGQVVGLLGPNGAGKTTAVRILSTTLRPDRGSAKILGLDVVKDAAKVRRIIGLAGQFATVDESLTGIENITMVGRLCHLPTDFVKRRAHELLEQFDLADAGGRTLKTYSGGMRRRLDLAAALVSSPPILFLDEPTTGLDPQSRLGLWEVIEALVRGGTTVLLTTQYLEEADRLAEDIVVIDEGKVIAHGTPAELKADMGATVLAISTSSPEMARQAATLISDLSPKPPHFDGSSVELTVEDGPQRAAEVLRRLDAGNVAVVGLTLREPSLDDVFLSLTGKATKVDTEAVAKTSTGKGRRGAKESS